MNSPPLSEPIPEDREGERRGGVLDREHSFLGRVFHRSGPSPSGADVSDGQGETELSPVVPSPAADQVDLHESRYRVVPFGPGLHRDPVPE